jgi:DNA-directed RNA polymerase subunit F
LEADLLKPQTERGEVVQKILKRLERGKKEVEQMKTLADEMVKHANKFEKIQAKAEEDASDLFDDIEQDVDSDSNEDNESDDDKDSDEDD